MIFSLFKKQTQPSKISLKQLNKEMMAKTNNTNQESNYNHKTPRTKKL
ncbi:MAG: hypothetical protein ACLFPL_01990 [Candidatus Nanoarchaeia archaeon]